MATDWFKRRWMAWTTIPCPPLAMTRMTRYLSATMVPGPTVDARRGVGGLLVRAGRRLPGGFRRGSSGYGLSATVIGVVSFSITGTGG